MKKLLLFCFTLIFIFSCESDNDITPDFQEEFSIKKIEYFFTENSEKSIFYQDLPLIIISNSTSVVQTYTYEPLLSPMAREVSLFSNPDPNAFSLIADSTLVSVPSYIDESNKIFLGEKKWLYSNKKQFGIPDKNLSHEFQIQPNTKLTIKSKLIFKEYKTVYVLTLLEKNTLIEKEFRGSWSGIYPIGGEHDITWDSL